MLYPAQYVLKPPGLFQHFVRDDIDIFVGMDRFHSAFPHNLPDSVVHVRHVIFKDHQPYPRAPHHLMCDHIESQA